MLGTMWQLMKTALVVRELVLLGAFAEIRITRGAWGLESRLFVVHHGRSQIISRRAAIKLCALIRKEREYESAKRISAGCGQYAHGVQRRAGNAGKRQVRG